MSWCRLSYLVHYCIKAVTNIHVCEHCIFCVDKFWSSFYCFFHTKKAEVFEHFPDASFRVATNLVNSGNYRGILCNLRDKL